MDVGFSFESEDEEVEGRGYGGKRRGVYPTDDILVVTQMSFAVLATIDLMAVQIDVVRETHLFLCICAPVRDFSFPTGSYSRCREYRVFSWKRRIQVVGM